jgi:hypothetical protein
VSPYEAFEDGFQAANLLPGDAFVFFAGGLGVFADGGPSHFGQSFY